MAVIPEQLRPMIYYYLVGSNGDKKLSSHSIYIAKNIAILYPVVMCQECTVWRVSVVTNSLYDFIFDAVWMVLSHNTSTCLI